MVETGVFFDDIHSYYDLNLILAPFVIPPAEPKTEYIDIPGGDGTLDLTEANGEVKFYDREFDITLTVHPSDTMTFDEKVTQVSNALNGKACKIVFDRDDSYYWSGRCSINEHIQDKRLKQIVVSLRVHPYKMCRTKTVVVAKIDIIRTNTEGTMSIADVFELEPGTYKMIAPVSGYMDFQNSGVTEELDLTISGITCIEIGASSTEKVVISNGNRYVYDAYLKKLVDIRAGTVEKTDEMYVTLMNGRKSVVPIIECSEEVTISYKDVTQTLSAGVHKVLDFQITEGRNVFKIVGTGKVTFTYQEGVL